MQTNAYGLMNLWAQGDGITRTVAIFLLSMSVLSWSVIVMKGMQLNRVRKQSASTNATSLDSGSWSLPVEEKNKSSHAFNPFRTLKEEGLKAVSYHYLNRHKLERTINQNEWLTLALRKCTDGIGQQLQADLPILASIGSTAPFVGLFGTVWGIYHALIKISASGQSGIDQIAGPVGEALIMTAFGLAVAIPAVLAYNFFLQSHKQILAKVRNFAHELQIHLLVENATDPLNDLHTKSLESARLREGVGV